MDEDEAALIRAKRSCPQRNVIDAGLEQKTEKRRVLWNAMPDTGLFCGEGLEPCCNRVIRKQHLRSCRRMIIFSTAKERRDA